MGERNQERADIHDLPCRVFPAFVAPNGGHMIESTSFDPVKSTSNASFGMFFALVFMVVAAWPVLEGNAVRLWALAVSALFLVLAMLWPRLLTIPNALWLRLGSALGLVVTPLVMAVLYFAAFVPMGYLMRSRGHDLLGLGWQRDATSYWVPREHDARKSSMKNQF
jgi:Saxitoxin biosynthesis operon protein SxtJ